jgi:hypothetical protein
MSMICASPFNFCAEAGGEPHAYIDSAADAHLVDMSHAPIAPQRATGPRMPALTRSSLSRTMAVKDVSRYRQSTACGSRHRQDQSMLS